MWFVQYYVHAIQLPPAIYDHVGHTEHTETERAHTRRRVDKNRNWLGQNYTHTDTWQSWQHRINAPQSQSSASNANSHNTQHYRRSMVARGQLWRPIDHQSALISAINRDEATHAVVFQCCGRGRFKDVSRATHATRKQHATRNTMRTALAQMYIVKIYSELKTLAQPTSRFNLIRITLPGSLLVQLLQRISVWYYH